MSSAEHVDSDSSDPAAVVKQGRILLRKKRFAEANAAFKRAIALAPEDPAAHEAMATSAFVQGDYATAAKHFEQAARCDARRAEPLTNLGAVLNKMKDYKAAITALQKSLSRKRDCPETYYNLGLAYRGAGEPAMAVSAYKEAIRLKIDFAEAHQNLGNAYLDQKNTRQATAAFTRALELKPDLAGAKRGLQRVHAATSGNEPAVAKASTRPAFASGVSAPPIVLTDIQRAADREIIHESTQRLERSLMAWLTEVRNELEPAVKSLGRSLTDGNLATAGNKTCALMAEGIRDADAITRLVKEARQLLQEHENDIMSLSEKNS